MMCKCMRNNCNNEGTIKVMGIKNRGGRSGWLCDRHARSLEGYAVENDFRKGNRKVNGFTYSMELETSDSNIATRTNLLNLGFIATSDCTVDVEYKSPIYEGLNAPIKHCDTIQLYINEGNLEINSSCGTHFHVGHVEHINATTNNYMCRFYHSLFIPLCEAMKANPEGVEKVFGRNFGRWADTIDEYTNALRHENFINLQHTYTIEYRICKYQNAEQMKNAIRCCKDFTEAIINNFIIHFNDDDFDRSRYATEKEYRKHKAQVTAKKLVKIFEKYANM